MMQVDARFEHADERAARIGREARGTLLRDVKAMALFCAVLAAVIAVGGFCAYVTFLDTNATAETRKWAETVLTALVSGGFSFLVGKAMANAP